MPIQIDEQSKENVKKILEGLDKETTIMFFEGENCQTCEDVKELVKLLEELGGGKLKVEYHNINEDIAKDMGVDKAPAIVMGNIRYYGIPSGHEFGPFVEMIVFASKGENILQKETIEKIQKIDKPVRIQVFITPTCPYCPKAVIISHMFAIANKNITSDMVEAIEFPEESRKYGVMAVPKIVINDKHSFEGAYPEDAFADEVLKALKE
jgi:glutaredoxin-like protein